MPTLVHVNGPPGIGKSTLAALYVDRHPGTLNLDIDRLHELIGGWQAPDQDTHTIIRPVALAMASAHLGLGRDVIVPQFFARLDNIETLEQVADREGAAFREVILLDDERASIDRFQRRRDDSPWGRQSRQRVAQRGGTDWLSGLYQQLEDVTAHRPDAVVIRSEAGAIEKTYTLMTQALSELSIDDP